MNAGFKKLRQFIEKAASWPGMPFTLFALSLIDFFVLALPSDAFFVAAILGNPARGLIFGAAMVLGRMAGVAIVSAASHFFSPEVFASLAVSPHFTLAWEKSLYFFERYGPLSLGITALSPFPMQFVSIFCTAAHAPLWKQEVFAGAGFAIRCSLLYLGVAGGKKLLDKKGD